MKWVYLLIAILTEVVATVAGYLVAFYCLSLTLREMPVGVAYAIWCGVGIVLVSLAAALLFGQRLDMGAIVGMALIIAGVIVINVFSKTVENH